MRLYDCDGKCLACAAKLTDRRLNPPHETDTKRKKITTERETNTTRKPINTENPGGVACHGRRGSGREPA